MVLIFWNFFTTKQGHSVRVYVAIAINKRPSISWEREKARSKFPMQFLACRPCMQDALHRRALLLVTDWPYHRGNGPTQLSGLLQTTHEDEVHGRGCATFLKRSESHPSVPRALTSPRTHVLLRLSPSASGWRLAGDSRPATVRRRTPPLPVASVQRARQRGRIHTSTRGRGGGLWPCFWHVLNGIWTPYQAVTKDKAVGLSAVEWSGWSWPWTLAWLSFQIFWFRILYHFCLFVLKIFFKIISIMD